MHGAGVEAADLEQVLDELLEAVDVGDSRSSAAWARSGMSSRWFSSTSTDAASVISGERSSWLTSEANRASRSMRSWRAWAMSLNESASGREVGVVAGLEPGVEPAAGDGLGGRR